MADQCACDCKMGLAERLGGKGECSDSSQWGLGVVPGTPLRLQCGRSSGYEGWAAVLVLGCQTP